ncbi:MAG: hypothetical protein OJJ54_15250 [Pseudonocardia sp.]|nr:hypothetical protein [Pseudonocardia sp.]
MSTTPDSPETTAPTDPQDAALRTAYFRPRPSPVPRRTTSPAPASPGAPEPGGDDPTGSTPGAAAPQDENRHDENREKAPEQPATLPALAPATLRDLTPASVPVPPPPGAEPPAYPQPQRSFPITERKGWRRLLRRG